MARRLAELLPNKKILSIDQVQLSDNINKSWNTQAYNSILKEFDIKEPSVLLDGNDNVFTDTLSTKKRYNIQLIQPLYETIKTQKKHTYLVAIKVDIFLFTTNLNTMPSKIKMN